MKKEIIKILIGLALLMPFAVFATVTTIDDFNSYTDGDLNGQGGWSGSTNFDVQGTTVQEGAKAIVNSTIANAAIALTVTARTNNIFSFYIRQTATNNTAYVTFYQGATFIGEIDMDTGPNIAIVKTGCSQTALATYSTDTWYKVEVEIDASTEGLRARVDGGTFTSWCTTGASFTEIDTLKLEKANNGTGTTYWDILAYDDQAASAAPNAPPTFLFFWISKLKEFIPTA